MQRSKHKPTEEAEPRKPGRPPGLVIELSLEGVESLCEMQATQAEIAHFFRVSLRTIENRVKDDPEFRDAMERGYSVGRLSQRRALLRQVAVGNMTAIIWFGKQYMGQRDDRYLGGVPGNPLEIKAPLAVIDALLAAADAEECAPLPN